MPEFQLDVGTHESAQRYRGLDYFTQGYIECMFFCGGFNDDVKDPHLGMLSDEAWKAIEEDCQAFQIANAAPLAAATTGEPVWPNQRYEYTMARAGHDYWYSRNDYGVGYGDRGLPTDVEAELERAAVAAGQVDPYVGDDGKIYL